MEVRVRIPCPDCSIGSGWKASWWIKPCRACNGTGYQERWETLEHLYLAMTTEVLRLQAKRREEMEAKP